MFPAFRRVSREGCEGCLEVSQTAERQNTMHLLGQAGSHSVPRPVLSAPPEASRPSKGISSARTPGPCGQPVLSNTRYCPCPSLGSQAVPGTVLNT